MAVRRGSQSTGMALWLSDYGVGGKAFRAEASRSSLAIHTDICRLGSWVDSRSAQGCRYTRRTNQTQAEWQCTRHHRHAARRPSPTVRSSADERGESRAAGRASCERPQSRPARPRCRVRRYAERRQMQPSCPSPTQSTPPAPAHRAECRRWTGPNRSRRTSGSDPDRSQRSACRMRDTASTTDRGRVSWCTSHLRVRIRHGHGQCLPHVGADPE